MVPYNKASQTHRFVIFIVAQLVQLEFIAKHDLFSFYMATPLSDATAGAIGASIANTIVFPLDV
jgi:hypothetical protein